MEFAENCSIYKLMYTQVSVLPHKTEYLVIFLMSSYNMECSQCSPPPILLVYYGNNLMDSAVQRTEIPAVVVKHEKVYLQDVQVCVSASDFTTDW